MGLTILGEDTDDRSVLVNVLNGVLDLEETAIGIEGGCFLSVLARRHSGMGQEAFGNLVNALPFLI